LLAIQPASYKAIRNDEFLDVIEEILGASEIGDFWQYEALFSLHGGKRIVCALRAREPLPIGRDPAHTYSYATFASQHDGSGGLRGIPANFRVECANLWKLADQQAKASGVGFTIRHTENWRERVAEAKRVFAVARQEGEMWAKLADRLANSHVGYDAQQRFLRALMPIRDDMSDKQVENTKVNREIITQILASPTCAGISGTVYGLVQATIEWADHVQPAHSDQTRSARTLLRSNPVKQKAFSIAMGMLN
jgi:phage/plasmid-like protein (TIGR03299 family)